MFELEMLLKVIHGLCVKMLAAKFTLQADQIRRNCHVLANLGLNFPNSMIHAVVAPDLSEVRKHFCSLGAHLATESHVRVVGGGHVPRRVRLDAI